MFSRVALATLLVFVLIPSSEGRADGQRGGFIIAGVSLDQTGSAPLMVLSTPHTGSHGLDRLHFISVLEKYGIPDLSTWKLLIFLESALTILLLKITVDARRAAREQERLLTMQKLQAGLLGALAELPGKMANPAADYGLRHFIEFFGIDCVSLFELAKNQTQFRLLYHRSAKNTPLRMSRLRLAQCTWTTDQLLRGKTVVMRTRDDVPQETPGLLSAVFQSGLRGFAGVPLKVGDRVFGAIFFFSSKDVDWSPRLLKELQTLADISGSSVERARSETDLKESEQLKTAILASLPSLVRVLDPQGNILSVNSSRNVFASSAGVSEEVRPGLNYFDICRRAAEEGSRHAEAALKGLQQVCSEGGHFEMEYLSRADGVERWFHMSAVPLATRQGGVVVTHTDVTERKLTELDLRESERRFRLMADSAPVLMWMSGPDKSCTNFNKGWIDFTGKRLEDQVGEGWMQGVHPDDLQRCLDVYNSAFDGRRSFSMEYRLRRFDGKYRWLTDRGVPRFKDDGTFAGYIGCCVDISEQKEAELVRSEIGGRMILAQEEERARIARELHDDINQKLGLLAMDIQQLQQRLPQISEEANALKSLFDKTNRVSADVQQLSHQLHSSRLDYLGLPAALRRLSQEFTLQHRIPIECAIQEPLTVAVREVNLCLFRVAQECLSNAAKHSAARHVRLELQCHDSSLRLTVSDDGKGFDPEQRGRQREHGLGLISMRERLRLVNGDIVIQSQQGTGTKIIAIAPLRVGVAQHTMAA